MAFTKPAVVTITPADRSNSPPIINMPTATATIPIVEAAYNTVKNDSGVRNAGATIRKNTKSTIAATAAPTSGRRQQPIRQTELHPVRGLRRRTRRRRRLGCLTHI